MGWALGLWFCHGVLVSHMCRALSRMRGNTDDEASARQIVRDKARAPILKKGAPLLLPYVDNGNAVAWNRAEAEAYYHCLTGERGVSGLVIKDPVPSAVNMKMVGLVFDG